MNGDKIVLLDGAGGGTGSAAANSLLGMIPSLFANAFGGNRMDPNLVAALMNGRDNKDRFGGEGCWWMWIILLFFLFGGRGFGNGFWGGNGEGGCQGLPAQLNNATGRELLMQAIQGNRSAIDQIASALNCTTQQLQSSLCNIQGAISGVANQVGMTSQSVINAIQNVGCEIGNSISSCCCNLQSLINQTSCNIQNAVTKQGYDSQLAVINQTNTLQNTLNAGFNSNREAFTSAINTLSSKMDAQTAFLTAQFNGLEKREMQNKIDALREEKAALQNSALLQQQSQNLISQLRPCPIPAYPSCSPYQSYSWGQVMGNACCNNTCSTGNSCCCNNA